MSKQSFAYGMVLAIMMSVLASTSMAQVDLRMGGYMQAWYIPMEYVETSVDTTDNYGFRVRRARMTGTAQINDRYSATIWYEFAGPTNNLLDFYFDARFSSSFNIRVGQFIPAGQTHDTARLVSSRLLLVERPVMTRALATNMGYNAFRDIGIMAYGTHGIFWYGVHAGNGTGRFNQTGTNISSRTPGSGLYGARVDATPIDGLTIGAHASINHQRDFSLNGSAPYDINSRSVSGRILVDGLILPALYKQAEFAMGVRDDTQNFDYQGWYAELGYRVTDNLDVLVRYDVYEEEQSGTTIRENQAINLGLLQYIKHDNREIARFGLNYRRGTNGPGDFDNYAITAWFQVRFIPVR